MNAVDTSQNVWEITGGGSTCTKVASAPFDGSVYRDMIVTVPGEAGNIFYTSGEATVSHPANTHLWKSTNNGSTWTDVNSNLKEVAAVGFGAAVDYLTILGMDNIAAHEHDVTEYALERLEEIPGVKVFGPSADKKGGVASFTLEGVHPHDVAQILDRDGIYISAL